MSRTFIACVLIAFAWMGLFYLWGRSFLIFICAKRDMASSVLFGYLVLQVIYQVIYLPFYFTRGSYRVTAYIWIGLVSLISVFLFYYLKKHPSPKKMVLGAKHRVGICVAVILVLGLAFYIALHVTFYGQDTVSYISTMNDSYYRDVLWVKAGRSSFHYGMSSMFQFFTMLSLLTGIKPYYISLFTVRIIGVCMFAMILYRTGIVVFHKQDTSFCWPALILSVFVPYLLMFWGSPYTAEFFYWRINEAKGYGQFVLLPLGFSIFLSMFKESGVRKSLWKEQLLVGLASVPVSASSLTPYIFLVILATASLLAYDKIKKGWSTIGHSAICVLPNIIYLVFYIIEKNGVIVL